MSATMIIPAGSNESDHHVCTIDHKEFNVVGSAVGDLFLQGTYNEQAGPWMNIIIFPHPSIATHIISGSTVQMKNCPYHILRVISDTIEPSAVTINVIE